MSAARPRWYRRLGVRVWLLVFLLAFLLDVVFFPLWEYLYVALTPEWSDPEFLHRYADWLAGIEPEQRASAETSPQFFEWRDRLVLGVVSSLYSVAVAAGIAWFVWWTVVRRIQKLAAQAASAVEPDLGLPAFGAGGQDEIALLACEMNALRERVRELLADLVRRDQERRAWVREVSHDLRTPLTALGVALERAQGPREPAEVVALLAAARQDVRRVQDLADDLLEIARLDAGEELVREPVPPGELLHTVVRTLSPLTGPRGLRLELELAPDLPELVADGRRLARALENLLLNSLQHAQSLVRVGARAGGSVLEITIEDDGRGFPAEGAPSARRPDSVGVGLEVARKVIQAHGGELKLANSERGVRVVVRLPLAPGATD